MRLGHHRKRGQRRSAPVERGDRRATAGQHRPKVIRQLGETRLRRRQLRRPPLIERGLGPAPHGGERQAQVSSDGFHHHLGTWPGQVIAVAGASLVGGQSDGHGIAGFKIQVLTRVVVCGSQFS